MQYQRDERQSASAILACGHELPDGFANLRRGPVANEAAGALQDMRVTENVDLRCDFLDTTTKSRSESGDIQHGIRVAMKEDEYIPRQKRPDVALNELRDCGSQDPLEIVQPLVRPLPASQTPAPCVCRE